MFWCYSCEAPEFSCSSRFGILDLRRQYRGVAILGLHLSRLHFAQARVIKWGVSKLHLIYTLCASVESMHMLVCMFACTESTEPKMPVRLLKRSVTYQPSTAVLKRPSSSWGEPKMLLKQWQLCISRQVRCTCQVALYDQRDCFEAIKRRLGYLAGNCKWVEKAVESKGANVAIFGTGKGM